MAGRSPRRSRLMKSSARTSRGLRSVGMSSMGRSGQDDGCRRIERPLPLALPVPVSEPVPCLPSPLFLAFLFLIKESGYGVGHGFGYGQGTRRLAALASGVEAGGIAQDLLQPLQRPHVAVAGGGLLQAEQFGHLVIAQLVEVPQDQHLAVDG